MSNIFSISLSLDTIITRCWDSAFLCKLEENLPALKPEVEDLKATRRDLMSRVRFAEDEKQLKRLPQVDLWLRGLIVHPRSTHKFGKQIATILQEVKDMKENGDFSDVACKPPIPFANKRPSDPTVCLESYVIRLELSSKGTSGNYCHIWLRRGWQTTLLNQINNKFHDTSHDYHVIWAVASQDRPIEKVQNQIAKRIGLSNEGWEFKSRDEKAGDIFNVLCRKKFALLLDDIWEWFDLTRAGVPLPTQQNGSKVIFTTRRLDVCCQMQPNMDNNIKVECLPQEKLSNCSRRRATSRSHYNWARHGIQEDPSRMEYATEVLRQSAASVLPGVGKEIRLSHPKDELVDCWIGEGLLDEHANLSNARNQGHFIIGSLIDACLLEKGQYNVSVKMHDVIRDMALWIAGESEKEKFL
ncbi:putative disease resistance protein At4g10780 [Gossypium hirsutum]|uniref:Disease resistance protein At4g10780 n=1 Tax=Gossypium hirsutum TaxID=3635 RepID=A0ABM2ZM81_GOSHI|nr:putative disease resistance protein At4g10780 [Gossypium hirsutum]